jgi:hypothetical protein
LHFTVEWAPKLSAVKFVALGASMEKAALATITSIGVVAMIESDFWPIDKVGVLKRLGV